MEYNFYLYLSDARINLKYGMKSEELKNSRETCTACAGTMLLEFAALSRLSGEPVFEMKAHSAMDALWKIRHRGSDLMGKILNIGNTSRFCFVTMLIYSKMILFRYGTQRSFG